jgi:hypothetical protein
MSQPAPLAARFSAADLRKSAGKLLDAALEGPIRITRRGENLVLLSEQALLALLQGAGKDRPESLQDLLRHYDAEKIKQLTRPFLDDRPGGKEKP